MKFEPVLKETVLVRRYKRFLADVEIPEGVVTIHCANTGAMHGCSEPGSKAWYSTSENPKRKYNRSLEMVQTSLNHLVCVNTARANQLVREALQDQQILSLRQYSDWTAEAGIPDGSGRFDFAADNVVMEVKMVSWMRDGIGVFPDAVSKRATRHVEALQHCASRGMKAILFFCVPHTGIRSMTLAKDIDAEYSNAVRNAMSRGMRVLAYSWNLSPSEWTLNQSVPFQLPD